MIGRGVQCCEARGKRHGAGKGTHGMPIDLQNPRGSLSTVPPRPKMMGQRSVFVCLL